MIPSNNIVVAAAVNDRAVLQNCLQRSPDIASSIVRLIVLEGYRSAAVAYNEVLQRLPSGTIVIFVHQDVYLPTGYTSRLASVIEDIETMDPEWALLAPSAKTADGAFAGKVWSTAMDMIIKSEVPLPAPVVTADEMLIIMKAGDGLSFDEQLPSFHLFASDIIQTALAAKRRSYGIDAPAVHHDKPVIKLDRSYREAYRYIRSKWWDRLPIQNLIAPITRSPFTLYEYDLRIRYVRRGARERIVPTSDPSEIAKRLGWE